MMEGISYPALSSTTVPITGCALASERYLGTEASNVTKLPPAECPMSTMLFGLAL